MYVNVNGNFVKHPFSIFTFQRRKVKIVKENRKCILTNPKRRFRYYIFAHNYLFIGKKNYFKITC